MLRARVIPVLLVRDRGLVKTTQFVEARYVGDPINAIRIFNESEVDELMLLDIDASRKGGRIDRELVRDVASECFMPLAVGGGIRTIDDIRTLLQTGVEKVVLNTAAVEDPELVSRAADLVGSQSVVVSVDVKHDWRGRYRVRTRGGTRNTGLDPIEHVKAMEERGAGELLVTSIDRDGTRRGYDLALVELVTAAVGIPVVAAGGAGSLADLRRAVAAGAAGVAAGSLFVFHGPKQAVLINFPSVTELRNAWQEGPA